MTSQSRLEAMKLPGGLSPPLAARLGQAPRAMGCMHSSESLTIEVEEDSEEAVFDSADANKRKGKKSLRPNSNNTTEQKSMELKPPTERSENMTIRVIWRRVSIFGSRRDSSRSCKSMETAVPGPSENSLHVPQAMSSNT